MRYHACPKSVSSTSGGKGIFPVAAYFGPEAGQRKGRNLAASAAMDGEASEAEGMSLFRSVSCLMTHRKIENAALLFNPLNELDVKHDFQRFLTVMMRYCDSFFGFWEAVNLILWTKKPSLSDKSFFSGSP